MALKNSKGNYLRITGIFIQHGKMELRLAKSYSEEERKNEPKEAKYFNEGGIDIPEELKDEILNKIYPILKKHKKNSGIDNKTKEESFETPYGKMEDC